MDENCWFVGGPLNGRVFAIKRDADGKHPEVFHAFESVGSADPSRVSEQATYRLHGNTYYVESDAKPEWPFTAP